MNMTLQQLEYIVALDTYKQFVKAADHCNVTQPTITTQVKKLEQEIGFNIFHRTNAGLKTTEIGQLVVDRARLIVQESNLLKEFVNLERDSVSGEYKVGVIPTISPYIVPKLAKPFSVSDCKLHIYELQTDSIIQKLKNEEIDIGILVTPIEDPRIREIPLYYEPFVAYCGEGNDLLDNGSLDLGDVEGRADLWVLSNGHCFRNQVLNICNPQERQTDFLYEIGSFETIKRMVDLHGGHTLIPELAKNNGDAGRIVQFNDPKPVREVSIVVLNSFYKEGVIDFLRKEILKVVPSNFTKNERYLRIKWR